MDREKIIKDIEDGVLMARATSTRFVHLYVDKAEEIVELLKKQEAVKPVRDEQTGRLWLCGNCGSYVGFEDNDPHDPNEFDKYCRECGRAVLWEGR